MGRRLDALETRMGTKLLLRTPAGHTLTAAGSEILRRVEDVEREVVGMSASPSAATQASAASYA
jgi:DNA-binding transcriptional LysR family regulator